MNGVQPEVIYEDNSVIAVRKPCNQPTAPDESGDVSLLDTVKEYIKIKYSKPGQVYIGLVHRLDRPACGMVVFARNSKSAARLSEQVRTHTMHRIYYAVLRSRPAKIKGTLTDYLLKDQKTNTVRVVKEGTEGAKRAELSYEVLKTAGSGENMLTLVRVRLKTGRPHQIRVQFAHIGCPLWGDQRYGFNVNRKGQQLALWAAVLELVHPIKKEKMRLVCRRPEGEPWSLFEEGLYPDAREAVLPAGTAEK